MFTGEICNMCTLKSTSLWIYTKAIYTTQRLPKTVTCNSLTNVGVLCKSSTQLAYVVVGELCLIYTVQLKL
jgi:hypothetical protein